MPSIKKKGHTRSIDFRKGKTRFIAVFSKNRRKSGVTKIHRFSIGNDFSGITCECDHAQFVRVYHLPETPGIIV